MNLLRKNIKIKCSICNSTMVSSASFYTYFCSKCTYWFAVHKDIDIKNSNDEKLFQKNKNSALNFLNYVRVKNYKIILNDLKILFKNKNFSLLDIGCANGLFLIQCKKHNINATGIEPNKLMCSIAKNSGLNVINGYFPKCFKTAKKFDVIILNDVFEHIPNINDFLRDVKKYLKQNGVLLINIPNSEGVVFQVGKLFANLGFLSIWNRLWLKMFYSPHFHYFNKSSLKLLLHNHSFKEVKTAVDLNFLTYKGLWQRILIDKNNSIIKKFFFLFGAYLIIPLLSIYKRDAFYLIFKCDN
jgi:2-polyprenyl-3-methyl-5-hydroxy-6-metoxy-1,4-benzoquinol methylase